MHEIKCICPECESELLTKFEGNPKEGFQNITCSVTKKGNKKTATQEEPIKQEEKKDEEDEFSKYW